MTDSGDSVILSLWAEHFHTFTVFIKYKGLFYNQKSQGSLIFYCVACDSVFCAPSDLLTDVLRRDRSLEQKMKFLRENDFLQ